MVDSNQDRSWKRILDKNYCNNKESVSDCKFVSNCISENVILTSSLCSLSIVILLLVKSYILYKYPTNTILRRLFDIVFICIAISLLIIKVFVCSIIINDIINISLFKPV